ncbi:hypothetical protein VTK73DRAFT_5649 [Phialemonium thermophilum]|uniref:Uncharacterized protein n=1 Tax=Phialemonium thermophilum TaxID=223376 RepID=A0ABR3WMB5_9PEZI
MAFSEQNSVQTCGMAFQGGMGERKRENRVLARRLAWNGANRILLCSSITFSHYSPPFSIYGKRYIDLESPRYLLFWIGFTMWALTRTAKSSCYDRRCATHSNAMSKRLCPCNKSVWWEPERNTSAMERETPGRRHISWRKERDIATLPLCNLRV